MTHVSFAEHDAQLELFLEGRLDQYKGKLNEPKHLSLFERMTGKHGEYDPNWAGKFVTKERELFDNSVGERVEEESELYDGCWHEWNTLTYLLLVFEGFPEN